MFYYEDSVQGKNLAEFIQEELNLELKVKRPRVAKGNKTYYLLKRSESVLNIVAVSYTHLDVYKRQPQARSDR